MPGQPRTSTGRFAARGQVSTFSIDVETTGGDPDEILTALLERLRDFSPTIPEFRRRFVAAERRLFATQGSYGGSRWAPLNPAYAEWKSRHFPGKGIMHRTDRLYESLTQENMVTIRELGGGNFVIGTNVSYAEYHQKGTPRMPARPVVVDARAMENDLRTIFSDFLDPTRFGGGGTWRI